MTRLATGQMQEETQELLDEYNELYNWEYNDMCDFIENYGETEFQTYYETYNRLVDDYGQNLVDEFAQEFDVDSVEHFEDMFQGQYTSGAEFAEMIASEASRIKEKIKVQRNQRRRPSLDDKILTDWNGLMISSLAKGYRVFNNPDYLNTARNGFEFIKTTL